MCCSKLAFECASMALVQPLCCLEQSHARCEPRPARETMCPAVGLGARGTLRPFQRPWMASSRRDYGDAPVRLPWGPIPMGASPGHHRDHTVASPALPAGTETCWTAATLVLRVTHKAGSFTTSVQPTRLILAGCRARSLSINHTLAHALSLPAPPGRIHFGDQP